MRNRKGNMTIKHKKIYFILLLFVFWTGIVMNTNAKSYRYYYEQLNETEKQIYDEILEQVTIQNREITIKWPEKIEFETVTRQDPELEEKKQQCSEEVKQRIQNVLDALIQDEPQFFWMDIGTTTEKWSFQGTGIIGNIVWTMKPVEVSIGTNYTSEQVQELNRRVEGIDIPGETRQQKLDVMHRYLCELIEYDETAPHAHEPYGALIEGRAVCEGYARSLKWLCDREEIPCVLVIGDAIDTNGNTVTDSSILSVSKVLVTDHYENEIINNDTELHNPNDTQNTTEIIYVNENDIPFVMLDTSASLTSPATREAVYIEFGYGPSNAQVKLFSSSIKLNGQNIATNNFIYPDDDIQAENQYFRQYIHGLTPTDAINGSDQQGSSNSPLHYSYKTYTLGNNVSDKGDLTFGTEINNIEGLYEIELQYRLLTDGQDYRRLAKFKFYLITENTYNQINESTTFNYTEKIDNTKRLLDGSTTTEDTPYSKQHYFKFTNIYTSVVTGGTFSSSQTSMYTSLNAPTVLMYPTLTYNPEKYKISYTKTLYNKQESYDLSFNTEYLANQTERGVLTITKTYGSTVTTERLYYTKNENGYYEVTLTFDEVGEYVFDKEPSFLLFFEMENSWQVGVTTC